jgi:hypothetical protein
METTFNIFLYMNRDGIIYELGVVTHGLQGSDGDMLDCLKKSVDQDHLKATRYPVPSRYMLVMVGSDGPPLPRLQYDTFQGLFRGGSHFEVFEEIFQDFDASATPLCCITPIIEGTPVINGVLHSGESSEPKEQHALTSKSKSLFALGNVVLSKGAEAMLLGNNRLVDVLLARHLSGDFGTAGHYSKIEVSQKELREGAGATSDTGKLNKIAITNGEGTIMSIYNISKTETLWIITNFAGEEAVTTVLHPSDY